MQILQSEDDAGGVEDRPGLGEDVCVDVHHQVTAGSVLHHEAHVRLGLKYHRGLVKGIKQNRKSDELKLGPGNRRNR